MDTSRKLTTAGHDRRHFLSLAAGAVAATQFGAPALAHAQTTGTEPADPAGTGTTMEIEHLDDADYVVVGGGTAGCVIAARLLEHSKAQPLQ